MSVATLPLHTVKSSVLRQMLRGVSWPRAGAGWGAVPATGAMWLGLQPPTDATPRNWSPNQHPRYIAISPPALPPPTNTCLVSTQYFASMSAIAALKNVTLSWSSLESSQPVFTGALLGSAVCGGCSTPGFTWVRSAMMAVLCPSVVNPQQSP